MSRPNACVGGEALCSNHTHHPARSYYSLTNNFYLNTFGHTTKPPSTLYPGQANVTQAEYEDISISMMSELWTDFGSLTEIVSHCTHQLSAPRNLRP